MRNGRWAALALLFLLSPLGAAERDEAWLRQRVEQVKGSDTTGWRKVPWQASLLAARSASEREKRPLFLFTLDGNIDTGRC
jgi:hypothetical protein